MLFFFTARTNLNTFLKIVTFPKICIGADMTVFTDKGGTFYRDTDFNYSRFMDSNMICDNNYVFKLKSCFQALL